MQSVIVGGDELQDLMSMNLTDVLFLVVVLGDTTNNPHGPKIGDTSPCQKELPHNKLTLSVPRSYFRTCTLSCESQNPMPQSSSLNFRLGLKT